MKINRVGEYVYDAWGNILYKSGSMADINPFRYRGYYYDTETGFYYLQTRYYDPTICRFINADNYELVSDLASSTQLNMYAYCGNNPIMYTDETGEIIFSTIGFILVGAFVGAATSAAASVVTQLLFEGEVNLNSVLVAAGTGLISGALSASPLGVGWLMAAGGILEAGSYYADCVVSGETPTLLGFGTAIASGIIFAKLGGNGANYQFNLSKAVAHVQTTINREKRRANRKYAEKATKAATKWLRDELFDQAVAFSLSSYYGAKASMWIGALY